MFPEGIALFLKLSEVFRSWVLVSEDPRLRVSAQVSAPLSQWAAGAQREAETPQLQQPARGRHQEENLDKLLIKIFISPAQPNTESIYTRAWGYCAFEMKGHLFYI